MYQTIEHERVMKAANKALLKQARSQLINLTLEQTIALCNKGIIGICNIDVERYGRHRFGGLQYKPPQMDKSDTAQKAEATTEAKQKGAEVSAAPKLQLKHRASPWSRKSWSRKKAASRHVDKHVDNIVEK